VYTRCPSCQLDIRDPGRDFRCPRCGSPVKSLGAEFVDDDEAMGPLAAIALSDEPRWKAVLITVEHLARLASILLFGLALALCFGALLYGAPQVFQNAPESAYGATLFILTPVPIGLVFLEGYPFLAYYVFLLTALVASGAYLIYNERRPLVTGLGKALSSLRAPDRKETSSGLVQLPQVFLAVFFFDYVFAIIVILTGSSPRVPAFNELPVWYQFYTFANASVWEEIAARTLLCGIPLMLAYILAHGALPRNREAPTAPDATPPGAQTLAEYLRGRTSRGLKGFFFGGGFKIGPLEAFFMVGSSLMFGLAHVPGWDIWKLLPTFIAGLGFAYLFLKIGIHAAILLHFSFDYLDLTAGMVPGFDAMMLFLVFLWFAVGAFYFGHYFVQAIGWARGMVRRAHSPQEPD
jgi:hypothetical protein